MSNDQTSFEELVKSAREQIDKFNTSSYHKSALAADEFKRKGNSLLNGGQPEAAIGFYNKAIINCPSHGDNLSLLTANRALALLQTGRPHQALADINLARQRGYPVALQDKLIKRETSCQAAIEQDRNTLNGHCNDHKFNKEPLCSDKKFNISIGPIEVYRDHSKGGGRAVRATRNIKSGELLLAERAYSHTILNEQLLQLCHGCMRVIGPQLFPCRQCNQVAFCSIDCESKAWSDYHQFECLYMDLLDGIDNGLFSAKLVLRIMLKNSLTATSPEEPQKQGLQFGSGYQGFCDLAQFEQDTNDYTKVAAFLIAFINKISDISLTTPVELMKAREQIVRHIRRCQVNSMHIHERFLTKGESDADKVSGLTLLDERKTGCGLFIALAMTNHSCWPNAKAAFFDGDIVNLIAIQDIDEGDEILISYGMVYKWHPYSERQQKLNETYFFSCRCSACLEKRQPVVAAYRCSKCKGPVLSTIPNCLSCKRKKTIDVTRIKAELQATEQLVSLGFKCLTTESDNFNKLMIGTKFLQDGLTKLNSVLYKNNTQIAIVIDLLATANRKLSRFDEAVECAKKYYDITLSEFDEDVYLFNSLIKLLACYEPFFDEQFEALKTEEVSEDDEAKRILRKLREEVLDCLDNCETQLNRMVVSYSNEYEYYYKLFKSFRIRVSSALI